MASFSYPPAAVPVLSSGSGNTCLEAFEKTSGLLNCGDSGIGSVEYPEVVAEQLLRFDPFPEP